VQFNKADNAEPCLIEGVTTGHRATYGGRLKAQSELIGDYEKQAEMTCSCFGIVTKLGSATKNARNI